MFFEFKKLFVPVDGLLIELQTGKMKGYASPDMVMRVRLHFADFRHDYTECEGLCRKAVAIAAAKGLLPPQSSYESAMAAMNRDELLLRVLTQIVGQIGQ